MKKANIIVPPSKSIAQRAIAASLLADGISTIYNPGDSNDVLTALSVAEILGAEIDKTENFFIIKGGLSPALTKLNFGESALSLRMFSPIAALTGKDFIISGTGTLLNRPITMLEEALKQGGIRYASNNGFLPLSIQGILQSGNFYIDGSVTSQVLTGLLMALPLTDGDSIIVINSLKSKPYIDITLGLLEAFGIHIRHDDNYEKFIISGNQRYKATDYIVEGDWSSAAFWFVAGAIGGEIVISGLDNHSKQADIQILFALERAGVDVSCHGKNYYVKKSKILPFTFDATDCPDIIPILTLLAALAPGTSKIRGASRLIHKESNRALLLQREFEKLGIIIMINNKDELVIEGRGIIRGGDIEPARDHRIAMTFFIASLVSESEIIIKNPDCINKSYPGFFNDFMQLTNL